MLGRLPIRRSLPTAATTIEPEPNAEAEVDHARAAADGGVEAGNDARRAQRTRAVGVPDSDRRVRIDPDDAERVRGSADHGADRRPVRIAVVRGELLRIEGLDAGSGDELLVGLVEAGVDHRHGLPGAGRLDTVGADGRQPPLVR
jgi:hypothetical protein